MLEITVFMEPKAKKRPKVYRWSTINPSQEDEENFANAVLNHHNCPKAPLSGQIRLKIRFYKSPPKHTPKWKIELMENGQIRPNINPDLDNLVKLALDAMNGIVWVDDRYIVECHSAKYFSKTPRIEIFVDLIPEIKYKKDTIHKVKDIEEFFDD